MPTELSRKKQTKKRHAGDLDEESGLFFRMVPYSNYDALSSKFQTELRFHCSYEYGGDRSGSIKAGLNLPAEHLSIAQGRFCTVKLVA
jgi:hypothetical protein